MEFITFGLITHFITYFVGLYLGYKWGYSKRERKFHEYPVQFMIGTRPSVYVDNDGGRTKITIQDKNLVEIIK